MTEQSLSPKHMLLQLKEQEPELFAHLQRLSVVARNEKADPIERLIAAKQLSNIVSPMMLASLRIQARRELDDAKAKEPKYHWVNGARVRVPGS